MCVGEDFNVQDRFRRCSLSVTLLAIALLASTPSWAGDHERRVAGIVSFPDAIRDNLGRTPSDAVPRPAWLDDRLWRQLVFNEWEKPAGLETRRTQVLTCRQARTLDVYVRGTFGDALVYSEAGRASWTPVFRMLIGDALGCSAFDGRITFGQGRRQLRDGRLNLELPSAADPGEFTGNYSNTLAFARTWSYRYQDDSFAEWAYSEIVFNANVDRNEWLEEDIPGEYKFQRVLAHEIYHVLGFSHVSDPASLMHASYGSRADLDGGEPEHVLLAYRIGPGVLYPGFADVVPALPAAGILLLATLLGLLGRRRLRAG